MQKMTTDEFDDDPDSDIEHEVGGTYEVTINEISTHVYRVEADDEDAALAIARDRYAGGDDGDLEGIPSDIYSTEIEVIE